MATDKSPEHPPAFASPGARVAYVLEQIGLAAKDAEDRIHVSAGYLSKIIADKRSLSCGVAMRLATLTGYAVTYLMDGVEPFRVGESGGAYAASTALRVVERTAYACATCMEEIKPKALICPHCGSGVIWPQ